MSDLWIAVIICLVLVISGAMPLISRRHDKSTPPIPRKETLRDWRNGE